MLSQDNFRGLWGVPKCLFLADLTTRMKFKTVVSFAERFSAYMAPTPVGVARYIAANNQLTDRLRDFSLKGLVSQNQSGKPFGLFGPHCAISFGLLLG